MDMKKMWEQQLGTYEKQNERLKQRLEDMEAGREVKLSNNMALDTPEEVRKYIAYNKDRIAILKKSIETA